MSFVLSMAGDADMPDAPPPSGASAPPAAKPAGTRISYGEAGAQASAEALAAAKQSGNITAQDANAETLALPAVRPCTRCPGVLYRGCKQPVAPMQTCTCFVFANS